ncbi:MAG: zinc ribbon domain-containing protein [Lachnospiraceae bacterium]|nr:zinc ribbon domain-containing protein [Lachnospiraceae bacterium]
MAMINCPECGQEISDKAKDCIHCGKVLIEEVVQKRFCSDCGKEVLLEDKECPHCGCPLENEKIKETVIMKTKKGNAKKIIIPIAIIAIIVVVVFGVINFIGSNLNEDEQLAYQNAVEMRNMMRDPDSFKLYDEMFLLKHRDDDGNVDYIYTIFKYGGANGYGAITTDEAIFKDGEYIMNYSDEPDEDDADYLEQLIVKTDLKLYMLTGDEETWEMVDVDIKKIKKKMGLE